MIPLFNSKPCYFKHVIKQTFAFTRDLSTIELKKYYTILNVSKESTTKEIKESFLRLSKVYHPDNKETGSHLKFVELKEAYDAVKDGPPATTDYQYTSTAQSSKRPSPHDDSWPKAYYRHNEGYQRHYQNFGGPYSHSETPWEDYKRDRDYMKRRYEREASYGRGRTYKPLVQLTLVLGAIAWIFIYSSALLLWDTRSSNRKFEEYQRKNYANYLEIEAKRARVRAERESYARDIREKASSNSSKHIEMTSPSPTATTTTTITDADQNNNDSHQPTNLG